MKYRQNDFPKITERIEGFEDLIWSDESLDSFSYILILQTDFLQHSIRKWNLSKDEKDSNWICAQIVKNARLWYVN